MPRKFRLERLHAGLHIVRPGSLRAYLVAIAIIAVAIAIRMAVDRYVSGIQFIFLSLGIMLATFLGGMRAGALASVAAILGAWFFILPVRFSFRVEDPAQYYNLLSFAFAALADTIVVGLLRQALSDAIDMRGIDAAVFASNPDAVLVADENGRVVRANEKAVKMFAYSRDMLIGMSVDMLIPERFRARHAGHRAAFAADPRAREMGAGLELFAVRANGDEFPVDVQIGPVTEVGEARVIVNVRDITQAKQAAAAFNESRRQQAILEERERSSQALQLANAKLSKIIEAAPVAIWSVDAGGYFTLWNPGVARIYGVSADRVIGRHWRELATELSPGTAESSEALIRQAREENGFQNVEVQRTSLDGTAHELSLSAAVLRDSEEREAGLLFIALDVGPTRELENRLRQAQKVEAIGQLTGGVAHDFNNLLAVIYGNLEMLGEHAGGDPDAQELVGEALKAAQRGASLTQQLLAFSRQQQLSPREVDIAALVSDTVGMLRRVLEESVVISADIAPGLWQSRIDPQQLSNALLNLAINARDAMPEGGTLTIAAENAALDEAYCRQFADVVPGYYVKVSIADNGVGMTKAVLERALEPFFTTKPVGSGTGLGLSMVYGFIKQSAGHMTLYSEPGLGTTISLYLPKVTSATTGEGDQGLELVPTAREEATILVVEDDDAVRKLQVRMLISLGYRTVEARDGAEGLAVLRTGVKIDLLLTDVVMPGGMSGPALAEQARALMPGLSVIFMSGYAPNTVVERFDLTKERCLVKPFTRASLAQVIRDTLEKGA